MSADDPMGTPPLFDAPQPEQLQPAQLPQQHTRAVVPQWRAYSGRRVPCDECITYLHQHGGHGPQPRSARKTRTLGAQQWRLCPAHATPRQDADKAAAEARKAAGAA